MKKITAISMLLCIVLFISIIFNPLLYFKTVFAQEVLYWGSRGDMVKQVQTKLKNWGYYIGRVDGDFGEKTYNAVRKFQSKNGLKVDGIVGQKTYNALGISVSKAGSKGQGATRQDEKVLLGKLITGEARGEPYIGQVAVGAVVLNRTRHPSFPNTIAGVIYQPGAFTAVSDGQINLAPTDSCLKAAGDALNGWDPTEGSRYYWNPATATSKWIWSRTVIKKIGKHWFGN